MRKESMASREKERMASREKGRARERNCYLEKEMEMAKNIYGGWNLTIEGGTRWHLRLKVEMACEMGCQSERERNERIL
jgi:hypothetical protein